MAQIVQPVEWRSLSVTLTGSLLTIFRFGFSGVHYFEVVAMAKVSIETKMQLVRRGDPESFAKAAVEVDRY